MFCYHKVRMLQKGFSQLFFAWSVKWSVSLKLWNNHARDWIYNFPKLEMLKFFAYHIVAVMHFTDQYWIPKTVYCIRCVMVCKIGFTNWKTKIALLRASMAVTYYIKLFRIGTERCNSILMSVLLLIAETINSYTNVSIKFLFDAKLITPLLFFLFLVKIGSENSIFIPIHSGITYLWIWLFDGDKYQGGGGTDEQPLSDKPPLIRCGETYSAWQ